MRLFAPFSRRRPTWAALVPRVPRPFAFAGGRRLQRASVERVDLDGWRGKAHVRPRRRASWAKASEVELSREEARAAARAALALQPAGMTFKNDPGGLVFAAKLPWGGALLDVVVKRVGLDTGHRSITRRFRPARAWRAWDKTFALLAGGFAVEWPLLVLVRRTLGLLREQVLVFERVPGPTLDALALDQLEPCARRILFCRLARTVRRIEGRGWSHFDTKATNWIVARDACGLPRPTMIDTDGLRPYPAPGYAMRRLVRALAGRRDVRADELELLRGHAS